MKPLAWFVCPTFGGTSEVWMYRQAVGMKRFDVHVICRRYVNEEKYRPDGIKVSVMPEAAVSPRSRTARLVASLRNSRRGYFDGDDQELNWFTELRRFGDPDVILCHFGSIGSHLAPLFNSWRKPTVLHFNGYDISSQLRNRYYRWRLRRAARNCSGFIVVADYMREQLAQYGASSEDVKKIPYGIPLAEFEHDSDRPRDRCCFVAVGRFVQKKRPDLTIRAFALCAKQCSSAELTMIGDGEMLEECRQLAQELHVSDRVKFLGSLPIDSVKRELQCANVFVQHSVTSRLGDKEGWPVAIAEAAASGLPVIATKHASIPEQIEHGKGGLLVDELDWQMMGKYMLELAQDSEKQRSMGDTAFRRISQFDLSRQIAELEDFLLSRMEKTIVLETDFP